MDILKVFDYNKKNFRVSPEFFDSLESKFYSSPPAQSNQHDGWVTARFSPHAENIIYLGDDPGNIGVFNVDTLHKNVPLKEKQLHCFAAHEGAIMDIVGVPNKETNIVSISGDSTIRCWDLEHSDTNRSSQLFHGHEGSVRSISFAPDNPNLFATGSRDGQVKLWDMRVSVCKKNDKEGRNSTITYKIAHPVQAKKSTTPSRKSKTPKYIGASVTSVVFANDYTVASASSNADTGIRLWDIRKPTHRNEPARVFNIPVTKNRQAGFGVTSLALDRFRSNLFVSCTNSTVFEYAINTIIDTPIRAYTGATIRDYYTQVACSPVSDLIACGSEDRKAIIWDAQDQYEYINDSITVDDIAKRRTTLPRWSCGGHDNKVLCVGWSVNGKHFMTLDDNGLRIWNPSEQAIPWSCCDEDVNYSQRETLQNKGIVYERIEKYKLSLSDDAMKKMDCMSLTPRQRYNSKLYKSPQKQGVAKRPLSSPFTSPNKVSQSPKAKISKILESPSKKSMFPLQASHNYNSQESNYNTPGPSKKKRNPFYNKYPTEDLPNFVYDRFVEKLIGAKIEENSTAELSKTSRKRIDDWWQKSNKTGENNPHSSRVRLPSVTEFGESACSKVIPEEQRNALMSPRKLVVKKSFTGKDKVSTRKENLMSPESSRRASRNLLHYFNKK